MNDCRGMKPGGDLARSVQQLAKEFHLTSLTWLAGVHTSGITHAESPDGAGQSSHTALSPLSGGHCEFDPAKGCVLVESPARNTAETPNKVRSAHGPDKERAEQIGLSS